MHNSICRFLAFVLTLALMITSVVIPVAGYAEESNFIDISINQTVFNKGDTIVLSWNFDQNVVLTDSFDIEFAVTHTETMSGIDFLAGAEESCVARDKHEGTITIPVDGSFYGEGYFEFTYRCADNRNKSHSQSANIIINRPADAKSYFDFKVSKHPLKWETGDVIDFAWDYTAPIEAKSLSFMVLARNGMLEPVGETIYASEPGSYKFVVPDTSSIAIYTISLYAYMPDGTFPGALAFAKTFFPGEEEPPTDEPTEEPSPTPTATPSVKPSAAPSSAPSAKPSSAPTGDPGVPGDPPVSMPNVELNLDEITIGMKQSVDTVYDVNGLNVTWKSANDKIAKVDAEGNITGVKKGKTTITATGEDGSTDTVKVTVVAKDKGVKKIKLSKKKASLRQGDKLTLKATLNPSNAKNKKVIWKSSDTSVLTVDSKGKVKAKGIGTATITAIASSGKVAECKITVNGAKVKKITIEGKKNMKVGDIQTLVAKIKPDFAENQNIKWKSSNKKIATVDKNGLVTALKKGTVTITATAKDGSKVKASFIIKIKK